MLWMLPVAGAVGGALLNKRDPLKGAMLGGLLGSGGAGAASALGAGAAGGAAAPAMANGAFLGEGVASGVGPWDAAMTKANMMGGLKTAAGYAMPVMQAGQAANMMGGLFDKPEQSMQAPGLMPVQNTGVQTLTGLAQAGQQNIDQLSSDAMKRRMMNQQIIQGMMGGGYGRYS